MRVAQVLLRSAAAAGLASFSAACVIPPAGLGPRPEELTAGSPDVALYSFDQQTYGAGSGLLAYSLSRDAYAATFEVDQRGRVHVLTPATPDAEARVEGGRSYVVAPRLTTTDRDLLLTLRDFDRVPYVFVVTSDAPLDLSAFKRGRSWSEGVTVSGYEPDSVIQAVADRVLVGQGEYASDFAYVGPRLRGSELAFTTACGRPVEDLHDYRYYRELWAVFTPQDQRLSYNPAWFFTPALGWSTYNFLPLAAYRAELATTAFYGSCTPVAPPYALRYATYPSAGYPYGAYSGYGYTLYGAYPYGAYAYGGYPNRTNPGPVVAGATPARPTPPLRLPRTPLGFTDPVTVADGSNATRMEPGARTVSTGRWLLGRRPIGFGPGESGATPDQHALGWRTFGSGRRPGEEQSGARPSNGFWHGRQAAGFNGADRRGADEHGSDPRPAGMGWMNRGGAGMAPSVHHDPGASGGQGAGRTAGGFGPSSGGGPAAGAPASPGSGAAAAIGARNAEKNGGAPAPQ